MEGSSEHKKGFWTEDEDRLLMDHVKVHGKGKWNRVAKETGLKRNGKSCRLRWMNYLNPSVKRGNFSEEEDDLIIRLHNLHGNRWSLIAGRVPGRTDNQVKNHWNAHLSKRREVKGRKDKINPTSSKFSLKLANNFNIPSVSSNPTSPHICNEKIIDKTITEGVSSNVVELNTSPQESTMMGDYLKNSFWVSYDDPKPYGLNSMELLDESFDFIFRGL